MRIWSIWRWTAQHRTAPHIDTPPIRLRAIATRRKGTTQTQHRPQFPLIPDLEDNNKPTWHIFIKPKALINDGFYENIFFDKARAIKKREALGTAHAIAGK
mmetsp:Transcript_11281/g.22620  ORF Transcript_11281/g.22620 Transcript_11281/m.22620 type:complete len:101 (-) Transcript_11281:7-309(-)